MCVCLQVYGCIKVCMYVYVGVYVYTSVYGCVHIAICAYVGIQMCVFLACV